MVYFGQSKKYVNLQHTFWNELCVFFLGIGGYTCIKPTQTTLKMIPKKPFQIKKLIM